MGQKIHPTGFRLSVNRDWTSKWYANSKHFPTILNEDIKVRAYLKKKLAHASVGKITIERLCRAPAQEDRQPYTPSLELALVQQPGRLADRARLLDPVVLIGLAAGSPAPTVVSYR